MEQHQRPLAWHAVRGAWHLDSRPLLSPAPVGRVRLPCQGNCRMQPPADPGRSNPMRRDRRGRAGRHHPVGDPVPLPGQVVPPACILDGMVGTPSGRAQWSCPVVAGSPPARPVRASRPNDPCNEVPSGRMPVLTPPLRHNLFCHGLVRQCRTCTSHGVPSDPQITCSRAASPALVRRTWTEMGGG